MIRAIRDSPNDPETVFSERLNDYCPVGAEAVTDQDKQDGSDHTGEEGADTTSDKQENEPEFEGEGNQEENTEIQSNPEQESEIEGEDGTNHDESLGAVCTQW